ncbi:hypothetical protein EON77_12190, partial [bacterium]
MTDSDSFFQSLLGSVRDAARALVGVASKERLARRAEARGELAEASVLYAEAALPDDVARVFVVRGDAERDTSRRIAFYVQAAETAGAAEATLARARRKRAALVVELASAVSSTTRAELLEVARDLEALGDHADAAVAYARAGDVES